VHNHGDAVARARKLGLIWGPHGSQAALAGQTRHQDAKPVFATN
jgi:hypothetical protein